MGFSHTLYLVTGCCISNIFYSILIEDILIWTWNFLPYVISLHTYKDKCKQNKLFKKCLKLFDIQSPNLPNQFLIQSSWYMYVSTRIILWTIKNVGDIAFLKEHFIIIAGIFLQATVTYFANFDAGALLILTEVTNGCFLRQLGLNPFSNDTSVVFDKDGCIVQSYH